MLASSVVRLGVRHKLIILGVLVILVVSSAFTWINLALARRAIEEDLKTRAIVYAREIAATLGQGHELGSGPALQELIGRLIEIRKSLLQLDVLAFRDDATTVVATNLPDTRLPFSDADHDEVRRGGIVLRPVTSGGLASSTTSDDVTRRLTIIETQVVRVIIITRLLDVTRHASGKAAPVDVDR